MLRSKVNSLGNPYRSIPTKGRSYPDPQTLWRHFTLCIKFDRSTDANDARNLFMQEKSTSVVRLFQVFIIRFPEYDATLNEKKERLNWNELNSTSELQLSQHSWNAVTAKMLWLEMIIQTIAYAGGTQSERAKGAVIMMTSMSLYLGNRRRVFAHPFFIIQSGQTENQGGQTQYRPLFSHKSYSNA